MVEGKGNGIVITYDEVAEWWENSDWYMSTYPPSAWFNYAEREGMGIDELRDNAEKLEDAVAELYETTDNNE